jgi:hypothetical protein
MLSARVRWLIAALWVGSLWTIGYLVAPTLFATLEDRALAGTIAGRLFRIEAWLSLACAGILLVLFFKEKSKLEARELKICLILVSAMMLCTLIGYFGLQPFMAALREAGLHTAEAKSRFGMLHGISSAIYLLQSGLGFALLLKVR